MFSIFFEDWGFTCLSNCLCLWEVFSSGLEQSWVTVNVCEEMSTTTNGRTHFFGAAVLVWWTRFRWDVPPGALWWPLMKICGGISWRESIFSSIFGSFFTKWTDGGVVSEVRARGKTGAMARANGAQRNSFGQIRTELLKLVAVAVLRCFITKVVNFSTQFYCHWVVVWISRVLPQKNVSVQ